ncbi:hypothetical protein A2574_03945 [Candidatus Shapirobacteria bacterium RIFOXYD1_FULL_38_32]|nr:MAG: hypothetical protein A2195_02085 [Candidatus Shapirobacteria bacterium RIFOXYA1_FULL_39_17]OGL58349.1 MAG: hypothetical protein A2574_03945 [Candidatus Shapirobacteria bacterium RIFOXYD1_FULL_38_32]HAP37845.1 hypothetical protein [Candidatus Shapirobacteria bacterium]HCU55208.1 hypothetical protein [Candidatus Shapirobacteria bacterium]
MLPSNPDTSDCLWKKVMCNPDSTSSREANPIQKNKCLHCRGSRSSSHPHDCEKFLENPNR